MTSIICDVKIHIIPPYNSSKAKTSPYDIKIEFNTLNNNYFVAVDVPSGTCGDVSIMCLKNDKFIFAITVDDWQNRYFHFENEKVDDFSSSQHVTTDVINKKIIDFLDKYIGSPIKSCETYEKNIYFHGHTASGRYENGKHTFLKIVAGDDTLMFIPSISYCTMCGIGKKANVTFGLGTDKILEIKKKN